ncbi:MAG: ADP-forming succinate--CoA ligase subunit beta [Anaerolineaceae bacterium]|nr:ADP-forming succinate--CoA ligase subunit beta [Anaerolineaceae bacterium]
MKLQEYQLKNVFRQYEIPVPDGRVTSFAREAKRIAEAINAPVVVKAQVLSEGRGMAGGIRLARTPEEAEEFASQILASRIKDIPVSKILIDEAVTIDDEYYVLITYDRAEQVPVLVMYDTGSLYIETAANSLYETLERVKIDPLIGLRQFQIFDLASRCNFPQKYLRKLTGICEQMWKIFCDLDALLVAINPLAITTDGRLLALDGKITLDDNAFFRQQSLFDSQLGFISNMTEYEAQKYGMCYFKMDGNIGVLANGAGLTMSCIDYLRHRGGRPANYLDMGGSVHDQKAEKALRLLYEDPRVDAIIVNVYGGKTHCDKVAEGLLRSLSSNKRKIPTIVRFSGTNADIALDMLKGSLIATVPDMPEAVDKVFEFLGAPANEYIN